MWRSYQDAPAVLPDVGARPSVCRPESNCRCLKLDLASIGPRNPPPPPPLPPPTWMDWGGAGRQRWSLSGCLSAWHPVLDSQEGDKEKQRGFRAKGVFLFHKWIKEGWKSSHWLAIVKIGGSIIHIAYWLHLPYYALPMVCTHSFTLVCVFARAGKTWPHSPPPTHQLRLLQLEPPGARAARPFFRREAP